MRRIKKAKIKAVSLVRRGANLMPVLYKDAEGIAEFATLSKVGSDGLLTTVVYPPEYRDGHGDIADAAVVKEMAYSHAREGYVLDVFHDGKALKREEAFVAESFIIQKSDARFEGWKDTKGRPVDVTGAWAQIIRVESPELRKQLEIFGPAIVEVEKTDDLAETLFNKKDSNVDKAELLAAMKAQTDAIVGALQKALTPEPKPAPKGEDVIAFEGDPSNAADLQKHLAKLQRAELLKSGALADPAKVAELLKNAAGAKPAEKTVEQLEKELADQKAESVKLEKRLAEIRKGSNQPEGDNKPDTRTDLQKQLDVAKAAGHRLAQTAAKARGYKLPEETVAK
jgi:hypothetical protein